MNALRSGLVKRNGFFFAVCQFQFDRTRKDFPCNSRCCNINFTHFHAAAQINRNGNDSGRHRGYLDCRFIIGK